MPAFAPMRLRLAYGVWTEECGSKVLFSRDYYPLWRISPDGQIVPEDPWRWVTFVDQAWFWDNARPPWLNRETEREIERRMEDMGVTGTPKLMDAVDIMVQNEIESIPGAVRLMIPPGTEPHAHLQAAR